MDIPTPIATAVVGFFVGAVFVAWAIGRDALGVAPDMSDIKQRLEKLESTLAPIADALNEARRRYNERNGG